jgi:hypothetical protein
MKGKDPKKPKKPKSALERARRAREVAREKAVKLAAKTRRLRFVKALTPPVDGGPAWSHKRGELRGFGPAEQTCALAESRVWREEMKPQFDARDAKSRARQFSTEELELLHFYAAASGYQTTKEMLEKLSGFWKRNDRRVLGLDRPRNPDWRAAKMLNRLDGIPSESTMSRHRLDLTPKFRRQIWERIMVELRAEELAVMDDAELLTINLDGTHLEIPYMPPLYEKDKDGSPILVDGVPKLSNEDEVTCEDGGILPKKSHNPGARGFNIIFAATGSGVALAPRIVKISAYEGHVAEALIEEDLEPLIGDRVRRTNEIGVLSADGAFSSNRFRKGVRNLGMIENVHFVSHANDVRAASESKRWMRLGTKGVWWVNGHREVVCDCGN